MWRPTRESVASAKVRGARRSFIRGKIQIGGKFSHRCDKNIQRFR